jgi:hypothetical protein
MRLATFVEEKRDQPFDWKHNNCAFFACDWIAILTGVDPVADLRLLTARELVNIVNGKPMPMLADMIAEKYGYAVTTVSQARRGDVVETETPDGPALGVCLGATSVFPGKDGTVFIKTYSCRRAWRID